MNVILRSVDGSGRRSDLETDMRLPRPDCVGALNDAPSRHRQTGKASRSSLGACHVPTASGLAMTKGDDFRMTVTIRGLALVNPLHCHFN